METADYILSKVASFAEAWIEIVVASVGVVGVSVASFAEAWIEILSLPNAKASATRRLLRGGVD